MKSSRLQRKSLGNENFQVSAGRFDPNTLQSWRTDPEYGIWTSAGWSKVAFSAFQWILVASEG